MNNLKVFWGKEFKIPPLPKIATKKRLKNWEKFRLSLYYLPKEIVTRDKIYPGWKEMIQEDWFYDSIKNGELASDTLTLPGRWILIDNRPKPMFKNGRQRYKDDERFLEPIIEGLRKSKKIDPQGVGVNVSLNSRFGIMPDEYDRLVRPELAKLLDISLKQIRLPRAIEWNYLSNAFYSKWGETNTWEWFDDRKEKDLRRLYGGCIDDGGISGVYWHANYVQFNCIGLRPLIVL